MKANELFKDLTENLAQSSENDRKTWAAAIVENQINLLSLSRHFLTNENTALRFSWLLSNVGQCDKNYLLNSLPTLFDYSSSVLSFNFTLSFATYWSIVGVPAQNEAKAIELMFAWLRSSTIKVTTKSRAMLALVKLVKKYPDLKTELKLILEEQLEQASTSYQKKVEKILFEINSPEIF